MTLAWTPQHVPTGRRCSATWMALFHYRNRVSRPQKTLLTFTFSRNLLRKCYPTDHVPMTYFPLEITRNYTEGAENNTYTYVFTFQHQLLRVNRIIKINPL